MSALKSDSVLQYVPRNVSRVVTLDKSHDEMTPYVSSAVTESLQYSEIAIWKVAVSMVAR